MALFFTILLGISLVGMGALLALKRFEMTTGKVVLETARPSIGAFFYSILVWIEKDLPKKAHALSGRGIAEGRKLLQYAIARTLVGLEWALERFLGLLRSTTAPSASAGTGEVSAFLREVAEHKKQLIKRSRTPNSEAQQ